MIPEGEERGKWIALLRGLSFFQDFSDGDLDMLVATGAVSRFVLHDYIIREGETDKSFFVVLKGKVKIIKKCSFNRKKELWPLETGECFGEIGFLTKSPRTASVLASEESYLFEIKDAGVEAMPPAMREKLYHRIALSLAEKLKSTTDLAVGPYFI